jgi:hypothetical protein
VWLSFAKWIFVNIGEGLSDFHAGFKRDLKREPVVAFVAWLLVSLLSTAAFLIILGALEHVTGTGAFVYIWYAYIVSCVLYLIYTGFSVMYNSFKAERAELFNTIKHGK